MQFLPSKSQGVIHSHLSAALLEYGGEMAVGNSRPLNRSSATLSYLHLSFHETFDIIYFLEVTAAFSLLLFSPIHTIPYMRDSG